MEVVCCVLGEVEGDGAVKVSLNPALTEERREETEGGDRKRKRGSGDKQAVVSGNRSNSAMVVPIVILSLSC